MLVTKSKEKSYFPGGITIENPSEPVCSLRLSISIFREEASPQVHIRTGRLSWLLGNEEDEETHWEREV